MHNIRDLLFSLLRSCTGLISREKIKALLCAYGLASPSILTMNDSSKVPTKKTAVSVSSVPPAQQVPSRATVTASAPVSTYTEHRNTTLARPPPTTNARVATVTPHSSSPSATTKPDRPQVPPTTNLQSRTSRTVSPPAGGHTATASRTSPSTNVNVSSVTKVAHVAPSQVQPKGSQGATGRRLSVSSNASSMSYSTNNDWDTETECGEPEEEEAPTVRHKPVQKRVLHPDSTVFAVTWADKARKSSGIAEAYIKALYGTKIESTPLDSDHLVINPRANAWVELERKLSEQGLRIATCRLGDMKTGEYLHGCSATKTLNAFIL